MGSCLLNFLLAAKGLLIWWDFCRFFSFTRTTIKILLVNSQDNTTTQALLDVTELDEGNYVTGAYIDLKKHSTQSFMNYYYKNYNIME